MLLDDDVMADGEPKPCSFSSWLSREEGIEHLCFHVRWNPGAIVADPDFHAVGKAFGRCGEGWHVVPAIRFRFALDRCIETV